MTRPPTLKLDPATTPTLADPPQGQMWQCSDCAHGATLPENAWYHRIQTGHGAPTLMPLVLDFRMENLSAGDVVLTASLRKKLRRALGALRQLCEEPDVSQRTHTVYMHLPAKPERQAIQALIKLVEDKS